MRRRALVDQLGYGDESRACRHWHGLLTELLTTVLRPAACAVPTPSPWRRRRTGSHSEERTQPGSRAVSDGGGVRAVSGSSTHLTPTQLNALALFSPRCPPPRPHAAIATPSPVQSRPAAACRRARRGEAAARGLRRIPAPRTARTRDVCVHRRGDRVSRRRRTWLRLRSALDRRSRGRPTAVASPRGHARRRRDSRGGGARAHGASARAGRAAAGRGAADSPSAGGRRGRASTNKMEMAQPDGAASIALSSPSCSWRPVREPARTDATPVARRGRHLVDLDVRVLVERPLSLSRRGRAAGGDARAGARGGDLCAWWRTRPRGCTIRACGGGAGGLGRRSLEAGRSPARPRRTTPSFAGSAALGGLGGRLCQRSGSPAWCGESGGSPRGRPAWRRVALRRGVRRRGGVSCRRRRPLRPRLPPASLLRPWTSPDAARASAPRRVLGAAVCGDPHY